MSGPLRLVMHRWTYPPSLSLRLACLPYELSRLCRSIPKQRVRWPMTTTHGSRALSPQPSLVVPFLVSTLKPPGPRIESVEKNVVPLEFPCTARETKFLLVSLHL